MKPFARLLLFMAGITSLSSCTTPSIPVATDFTRLSTVACGDTANGVMLFFEGEDISFQYDKVGLIEVSAAEDVSTEKILAYLKNEAWQNCANAVINVHTEYKAVSHSHGDIYSKKVFYGLGVRMKADASLLVGNNSFRETINEDNRHYQCQKKRNRSGAIVVFGLTLTAFVFNTIF